MRYWLSTCDISNQRVWDESVWLRISWTFRFLFRPPMTFCSFLWSVASLNSTGLDQVDRVVCFHHNQFAYSRWSLLKKCCSTCGAWSRFWDQRRKCPNPSRRWVVWSCSTPCHRWCHLSAILPCRLMDNQLKSYGLRAACLLGGPNSYSVTSQAKLQVRVCQHEIRLLSYKPCKQGKLQTPHWAISRSTTTSSQGFRTTCDRARVGWQCRTKSIAADLYPSMRTVFHRCMLYSRHSP